MKLKKNITKTAYHLFVVLFGLLMIYPVLWMISGSFKDNGEILRGSLGLIPESLKLTNYSTGWSGFGGITFATFFKNSIVTTVIIQFYWKWDDYMGPLLYLSKPQSYTVSLAIKMFADASSTTDYGAMFAMSTLSLIPVFLIFLFFNRYLVEGIGTSGLKG